MTVTIATGSAARDLPLGDFSTEAGGVIPDARLRYRVFGDPEAARENGWMIVFHALTGSADLELWWEPLLGPDRALDTNRHAIIAANLLGSCYGSTGPAEWSQGRQGRFPALTTVDMALAHLPLLEELEVERVALATGGSLGGMVAMQWGRLVPVPTERLVVFAAPAATSAQSIAWNAAQRMAIEADPAWQSGCYAPGDGPSAGLAAARAIAMITYRSAVEFEARFGRERTRSRGRFDVDHYLRRQGQKLAARFDARSYVALMDAMDLHDVGNVTAAGRSTAANVAKVIGVGIDTDILYAAAEVRAWVEAFRAAGADAEYHQMTTPFGHDAFLIEFDQVDSLLRGG